MGDRKLLLWAVWGEPADIAERRLDDWNSYLDEFIEDHSYFEYLVELFSGIAAHFFHRWFDESVSAVPMIYALALGALTTPLLTVVIDVGVVFSPVADIHVGLAYALFAFALVREEVPKFNPLASFGAIAVGTGNIHEALTLEQNGDVPLLVPALILMGSGMLFVAVSSVRQRVVVGASSFARVPLYAGLTLNVIAYVSALQFDSFIDFFVGMMLVTASALGVLAFDRIWVVSRGAALTSDLATAAE